MNQVINWISSYPKSGNTWVRFMLLNLIHGQQSSTIKLDSLIPDIHKCSGEMRVPAMSPVLIKTHFLLSPAMPLFDLTAGFIYIIRNPMDVMLSNLNYAFTMHGTDPDPAVRNSIKGQYIEQFIAYCGDPNWIRLGRGSWVDHVRSWIANELEIPGLLMRYEDLLSDPVACLGQIVAFLGISKSQQEMEDAVNCSSFDKMKSIEEDELTRRQGGFFLSENSEKSIVQGGRFMHRGMAGEGEKVLTIAQRERFLDQFGATMELAGYRI